MFQKFIRRLLNHPKIAPLLSDEHVSVDGTLPDSRLYRKAAGREAKLSYMGHALMENRHGLAVGGKVTQATGTAEWEASEAMWKAKPRPRASALPQAKTKRIIPAPMLPICAKPE